MRAPGSYGGPVAADLDRATVIFTALEFGWRPDPLVQLGVTIADCFRQGDKFGRYWSLTEPRELGNPEDRVALEMAADAATTFLNSVPFPDPRR
jgi:hypothetical protein